MSFSAKTTIPTFLEKAVVSIVSPFQSLFFHSIRKIQNIWHNYISLTQVRKNNLYLKEEIEILKHKALKYTEQNKTFERLSKMLKYKLESDREMILASVVGSDAISWSNMITINKGFKDGLKKSMAVVTYEGLVGHIVQTVPFYSKVLLITDVRSAVDALDQDKRTRGVVVGKGSDICEMKYISHDADIRVGSPVISSGLGGVFPKGLLIGRVSKVEETKKGLFRNVVVTPSAKISFLEEVFVLK
ncbi:MAG: rod shape-determining protein MreC [Nitrospinota bacterium]|nr:rod shape-determining protein MreC [Nitrospinota bacterium]